MVNRQFPQRKSPRLDAYDYSDDGAYFVTICTHQREYLFGQIIDAEMIRDPLGEIVLEHWYDLSNHFNHIELDAFIVMPNHVHGIIFINKGNVGTTSMSSENAKTPTLGTIIGSFKAAITRSANRALYDAPSPIWQSRYHDHIIRNETELNKIREYVIYNPESWDKDTFYDQEMTKK